MPQDLSIKPAVGSRDLDTVRQLWREYWESFGLSDDFQNFGQELAGLPGAYARDGGVLLIAWSGDMAAGTVALRRLNQRSGEIKRMYVRPKYRGRGLGRLLLETLIEAARRIGYQDLYADTLPSMTGALNLYPRLGFENVGPYSDDPTPCGVFFQMHLAERLA